MPRLLPHEIKFLRDLAKQRKLSDFARKVGISRVQLSRYANRHYKSIRDNVYQRLKPHLPPPDYSDLQQLARDIARDPDMEVLFFYLQDHLETALRIHIAIVRKGWSPAKLASECYRIIIKPDPDKDASELVVGDLRIPKTRLKRDEVRQLLHNLEKHIERALLWGPQDLEELVLIAKALGASPAELFVPQPDAPRLLREVMRIASRRQRKDTEIFNDLAEILGLADEVRKL